MKNSTVVKHVRDEFIDVFWGNGWWLWSRNKVELKEGNKLYFHHIAGLNMPYAIRQEVIRILA